MYLSIYPSIYLSIYLILSYLILPYLILSYLIYLSIHPSINLSINQSIYLSVYLSICKLQNLWYFARLLHFSKLTTSNTQQICVTSSFFTVENIKNEAILRDFLNFCIWQHQKRSNSARLPSKMESWVQSWRPRTNAFCDFSTPPV